VELACSEKIKNYFEQVKEGVNKQYLIAQKARSKGFDPEDKVDIPLAATVAQRVEGLVSSVAPNLLKSGMAERIVELEKKYSPGDWRVALIIAEEVAKEKFCKFENIKEAIEVGIRAGFSYITLGVVSAPLEGLVEIKFKKRKDGKDYLAVYYAGPIRSAGGTAAAVSVLIADYVRRKFGIADYDPTDEEIKRYQVEIEDYLAKVAHRQYKPTAKEIEMMIKNIKVEITGDPTERYEVSQCKRLERVETDLIRGGMALVLTEGPSLKAEKLWKKLRKWKDDFGLSDWGWLEDFIALKTKIHSAKQATKKDKKEEAKIVPIDSYLTDMVAGRPVFGYPMRSGSFRLRYGRARTTGFAAMGVHPATMIISNNFIATGTQLKVERPGKSTVVSPVSSIDGPIVKLKDGSVVQLQTEEQAIAVKNQIKEILYLGDLLINYGDFSENNKRLAPAGYCREWWIQEAKKSQPEINEPKNAKEAIELSEKYNIPLHPDYTYFWKEISKDEFLKLRDWFKKINNNVLPLEEEPKRVLEILGCPHLVKDGNVLLDKNSLTILNYFLNNDFQCTGETGLDCINSFSKLKVRDKSGTFIGCRMGRPEKAKLRKMKGSPHVLFPVGEEGGRLRNLRESVEKGKVTADWPIFICNNCKSQTIYPVCEICGNRTELWRRCPVCRKKTKLTKCHTTTLAYERQKLDIQRYWKHALAKIGLNNPPPIVKGVKGTFNKDHLPEYLPKGLLRAVHNLYVNKDGTIRYDITEMGLTHFKPKEIGTSIEKLRELGYKTDIEGKPLENDNQILEIFPQDVILPSCPEATEEGADKVLFRVSKFVDDILVKIYGLEPFYNLKSPSDLVGHLIIGLAPHTSAGIVGRIIGFSKTQGCFAHPYWHAAQRRNLDGDETCVMLLLDAFLNFSRQYLPDRRGGRSMDAPLVLTTILDPAEIDDEVHGMDVVDHYPLEFYEATLKCVYPWEIEIEQVKDRLGKPEQYEGLRYTHEVEDLNSGIRFSAYKEIPTMVEKMQGQMDLAAKIRAVDLHSVASLVIDKHFVRDIKGNLRKFTKQEFRCTTCNEKYRRPPLSGKCKCGGKLVFTIAEGTIKKYLEPSLKLVQHEGIPEYMKQSMLLLKRRITSIFGEEKTKQIGLGAFI